jgi:autotransporter-associated beta strand protein
MRYLRKTAFVLGGAVALCFAKPCAVWSADVIIVAPVGATASSIWTATPGYVSPQYLIDGSGLTGTGRMATHTNANATNLFWHSNTGIIVANQWVEFDLGAAYHVTNALIWQMAQISLTSRGVKAFTIKVADSDHAFWTYTTNNALNIATGQANEPVQVVPLMADYIQYVRFEIESNWGASGIVGLSEVRFEGTVPEPRELTWNGTSDNATWNFKTAQTWLTNGSVTAFEFGDHVRFDDTAAEKNATISNNLTVGKIVVDNTGTNRISAGTTANNRIIAAASFVKRGSGVLEMAGGTTGVTGSFHSFTNGITIAEGTLKVVSNGQSQWNAMEGLLGNMQAVRNIRVNTNATLNLTARYLSGRIDSIPVAAVVVDHGTLSITSSNICENAFGPLTFDSAKIECVNTQANTYVAFNGRTVFMGTSTVYLAQSGSLKYAFFMASNLTEVCVSNITQDSAWDVRFDWVIPDYTTNGMVLVKTSGIRKTGAGTLYLGNAYNTLSGNITVSEGVLEVAAQTGINQASSVLGNPKISHKVRVESGAVLKIDNSNTFGTGFDSPLTELEIVGGTLSLANGSSSVFGPLTLENANIAYNTGYGATDWAMMIFGRSVTFKGTQPYVFSPVGANCNMESGLNEETEINVWDITGTSSVDVALNLPFINFTGVTNKPPSRFKKTGPGTLSLGAVNTSTGALRVVEGVLRVDGQWNAANSSVTAENGGYLGGTGSVARAVFNGGGFECAMGQTGLLTVATAAIGSAGTIRILNPNNLPREQLGVPFLSFGTLEGGTNLVNWTVEVAGYSATKNMRVLARNGTLTACWAPQGTLIRLE